MTDDHHENKPQKLTLHKLSIGKKLDPNALRQNYVSRSNNVTVEVKKSKAAPSFMQTQSDVAAGGLTTTEFSKRLDVIRRASTIVEKEEFVENAEKEVQEGIVGSLSDFGIEKSDIAEVAVLEDDSKDDHSSKHAIKKHPGFIDEDEESLDKKTDAKTPAVKPKIEEPKKLKKSDIFHMLDADGEEIPVRTRSLASIRRAKAKEKRKIQEQLPQEKVYREVILPEVIAVSDLASRMSERVADVVRELMKLGIIATANQTIDADTAELIATGLGHTVKRIQESDVENILQAEEDSAANLTFRAPVVTVMGHVDHGKTSLLDALKETDIVSGEAGGITQHIGAYRVTLANGKAITFIDTPGHEAFTEMRTRGAKVTDIVILVVAADDGIKTQTIEAINHAKAANVPIIVAINKIDKPDADITRVKNELLQYELVSEDLGGDIIVVPVSALKRQNLDKLEEAILLLADMGELKANYNAVASGAVIESKIDKGQGVISTVLVQRGTLRVGDLIVAGESFGRIKRMTNDKGVDVKEAYPSEPVEIFGLDMSPFAGDQVDVVQTEKQARDITEYRARKAKDKRVSVIQRSSLEDLFHKASGTSSLKELPVILKGDVQGSIEAIIGSIAKLAHEEVIIRVLHSGVGGITESDVQLAAASNAIILGFNVRASNDAKLQADKCKVDIRYYSIIYNLIDDMRSIMSGMLSPLIREEYIGSVQIRQVINITKVGKIAGSYVTRGTIKRGAGVRLLREDIVIHEGKLKTLKRFKEDVKEVREGFECGIAFENYDDIKEGDTVEVFEVIEERRSL
jgi:translation initiation factor IF-2